VQNEAGTGGAAQGKSRRNVVSDGVSLAYQVIDTYLKQGEKFARQFVAAPYGPATGNGHSEAPDVRSIQLLTELMANWSDLVGVYTEALSSANGSVRPSGGRTQENPPSSASTSGASTVQLAYELTSRRPALVDVEFFPGRETSDLACHGLRCLGSGAAEIAVMFDKHADRQRTVVSIYVPDEQPVGLYTGALMNSHDGSVVGSVSLRIR
jgi:hypothetical protein